MFVDALCVNYTSLNDVSGQSVGLCELKELPTQRHVRGYSFCRLHNSLTDPSGKSVGFCGLKELSAQHNLRGSPPVL